VTPSFVLNRNYNGPGGESRSVRCRLGYPHQANTTLFDHLVPSSIASEVRANGPAHHIHQLNHFVRMRRPEPRILSQWNAGVKAGLQTAQRGPDCIQEFLVVISVYHDQITKWASRLFSFEVHGMKTRGHRRGRRPMLLPAVGFPPPAGSLVDGADREPEWKVPASNPELLTFHSIAQDSVAFRVSSSKPSIQSRQYDESPL
jgi:hypothetical protein